MRIARIPREEFLARRFDYQPGEHALWVEPTAGGKTHLMYQCADVVMTRYPHLAFCSLMPKTRDAATRNWAGKLDLTITGQWPPKAKVFSPKPRGHVFWPPHLGNADVLANRAHLEGQFREALGKLYRGGNCVVAADDIYVLAALLHLTPECEEFWTAGTSAGAGLWATMQKPSGTVAGGAISTFAYSAPTHYVFGRDTDVRNNRRLSEIGGGVDPDQIAQILPQLRVFRVQTPEGVKNVSEKLYLHKGGPYMCIVGL